MHQAGSRRGVIGPAAEDGVTELQAEDDAAVADRQVRMAVHIDPVRAVAEHRVLDHAEQVDGNGPGRGSQSRAHRALSSSG